MKVGVFSGYLIKKTFSASKHSQKFPSRFFESNLKRKNAILGFTYRYLSCKEGNEDIFSSDMLLLLKSKVSRLWNGFRCSDKMLAILLLVLKFKDSSWKSLVIFRVKLVNYAPLTKVSISFPWLFSKQTIHF